MSVDDFDVDFPDMKGRNSVITFTDVMGNTVRVALSTSATDDLRKALGPSPFK